MEQELVAHNQDFMKLSRQCLDLQHCITRSVIERDELTKRIFQEFFIKGMYIIDKRSRMRYKVKRIEYSKRHQQWALSCSMSDKGAPLKVTMEKLIHEFDF